MTDLDVRRTRPGPPPARRAAGRSSLRSRRWWTSWRAAVRLAKRDSLRHKGSAILIMVMIGLPVMIISAGSALAGTLDVSPVESLPVTLGTAQAEVTDTGDGPLTQAGDASSWSGGDVSGLPAFPGRQPGTPWTAAQLASLTGGVVVPVGYPTLVAEQGTTIRRLSSLAVGDPTGSGLVTVVSGRLPAGPDEVAVTAAGVQAGVPSSGTAVLQGSGGSPRTVAVTGTVRALDPQFRPVDVVADASWIPAEDGQATFLVQRAAPVSWADVQAWNAHGLLVLSRQVAAGPEPAGADPGDAGNGLGQAVVVLVCLGLLLETTLLAGPAFAVSAARRRRSLALIGSNGADQAQLTRYVVAQGLVLGGLATLVGLVLGTALGWVGPLVPRLWSADVARPPLGVYGLLTAAVAVAAVVAALVAAAIPAQGAARLALAGVLTGQEHRVRKTTRGSVVGAVVVGVGLVAVLTARFALQSSDQLYVAAAGAALMVLGVLPCIHLVLRLLDTALRRGPVPLRMAARDASRASSRSASAIAATTVAVAVLTILATANTSDDAQQRRDYTPHTVSGHGTIGADTSFSGAPAAGPTLDAVRRLHPDWRLEPRGQLGSYEVPEGTGRGDVVAAVPTGCTPLQAIASADGLDPDSTAGRCVRLGSNSGSGPLAVLPADALLPGAQLSREQRRVLDGGGLLVSEAQVLQGDRVRLAVGTYARPAGGSRTVTREVEVPAALLRPEQASQLLPEWGTPGFPLGLMLNATATQRDLPVQVQEWEVVDPHGAISRSDEKAVNEHADAQLSVERGYSSQTRLLVLVLMGIAALLVAAAALISTALAQVEAQGDLATMAALGATRGFRRRLAGAQALLVALTGAVLGVVLGLAPGVTIAYGLTTDTGWTNGEPLSVPHALVLVPWLGLGLVVVTVPLLAALLAALSVRSRPTMTRRLG